MFLGTSKVSKLMSIQNRRKFWWHLSDEELRIFATLFVIQIPARERESVQRTWWERMQKLKPLSSKNLWPSTANSKKILPFYCHSNAHCEVYDSGQQKKENKTRCWSSPYSEPNPQKRLHGTFRWCLGQSWWPYFRGWTCRNLPSLGGDHRKTLKWESKSPECRDIENHILYLDLWKHISSGLVSTNSLIFTLCPTWWCLNFQRDRPIAHQIESSPHGRVFPEGFAVRPREVRMI